MTNPICNNQPVNPPKQPGLPGSRVAARVRGWFDEIASRAGVLGTNATIELSLQREYAVMAASAAHIPLLKKFGKLENVLAASLGWKSWLWQAVNGDMTEAGAVRYALTDKAKAASNVIKAAALYKAVPDILKLYDTLKSTIPDVEEWVLQELLYDHVVAGQFPRLLNITDSPVARFQVEARYTQHLNRLQGLGLTPPQIKELDTIAGRISGHFDALRQLAGEAGLDISVLRNGGYFPVQAEGMWTKFLTKAAETANISTSTPSFMDTGEFLRRARASNVPIVLDLDTSANLLGMTPMELTMQLSDPGKLSKLINSKLSPEQIDKLFDSGVLGQMPAMSDELTEFFRDSLDLPIANLGEAITLDPVKAIEHYSQQLSDAAKNSSLFKTLFTDGIDAGWLMNAADIPADRVNDFVRLGSDKYIAEFINASSLREEMSDLMLHRTVQTQLRSLLKLNTSWSDQSMLGRYFEQFTGMFRKSSILSSGLSYIKRVTVQNAVALHAATGDLSQLGVANVEVLRAANARSLDFLDDSKVFAKVGGKEFTLRSLFETAFVKRASENISGTEEVLKVSDFRDFFKKLQPDYLKRFWQIQMEYHRRFGSPMTGAKFSSAAAVFKEITGSAFEKAYTTVAYANQMSDFAFRWAAIRQLALEKGGQFTDIDALIRYTDEYFGIQEDVGSFGRAYGKFGQPFASFAFAAPGSALRYTLAHPWRAGRMGLLYATASNATNLSDAEMSQWQKDSVVISLFEDPITKKRYGITPGSVDFYLDNYTWFKEMAEDVGRSMGLAVGTPKEQVEQKKDPVKPLWDTLKEVASNTYLSELLPAIGIDPNTLENYVDPDVSDTLVGIPLTRRMRDLITGTLPLLRTLDKNLPPEIVGTPEQRTGDGLSVTTPGQPGFLGFTPSYGGNKQAYSPNPMNSRELIAWLTNTGLGITLTEIDPQKNIIRNYADFDSTIRDLSGTIADVNKKLVGQQGLTETEKTKLVAQLQSMQKLRVYLEWQKFTIERTAREKGLTPPTVVKYIQQGVGNLLRVDPRTDLLEFMKTQENQ